MALPVQYTDLLQTYLYHSPGEVPSLLQVSVIPSVRGPAAADLVSPTSSMPHPMVATGETSSLGQVMEDIVVVSLSM